MPDDDKDTESVLRAIKEGHEAGNISFILLEMRAMRSDQKEIRNDMKAVKESLASGSTTFATTDLRIQQLAQRVLTLEQGPTPGALARLAENAGGIAIGALGVALMWFLLSGALHNANGLAQPPATPGAHP